MTTQKVRRGMHVRLNWPILRAGVNEDFSNAESLSLHISRVNNNVKTFIPDTHISISGNLVSFIVTSDMLKSLTSGEYKATIAYRKVSATSPTLWEPYIKDEPCFALVDSSAEIGGSTTGMEVVTIELDGEIGIPKEGQPGASAYRIALAHGFEGDEAEWLLSLKQPAIEAAALAIQAAADFETLTEEFNVFDNAARTSEAERDTKEGTRIVDEQLRKTSEIGRETKEGIREGNEEERKQAELDREFFFDKNIDESIEATAAANAAAIAASLLEPKISDNIEPALAEILSNLNGRMQAFEQLIKTMIFKSLQIDNLDVVKNFTLHGSTNLFLTGSVAPINTPDFAGQYYINTTAGNGYIAVSENVWLKIADAVEVAANSAGMASIKDNQEPAIAVIISHLNGRISALESIIKNSLFKNVQIDTADIVKALNLHGGTNLILIRTVAPAEVPDFIGQTYVNTAAGVAYEAVGTTSVSNWKQKTN